MTENVARTAHTGGDAAQWATEAQTEDMRLSLRIRRVVHQERTSYQDLAVYDTAQYGRALFLDGTVQTTEADEFAYHEALVHVPLFAHPAPRGVLIIGGGDGGAVREALKHPTVERVHLVEIDDRVVEVARRHLAFNSAALDDPRVRVIIADGIRYVAATAERYDVVIIDSTDPVGPAVGLFTASFYSAVRRTLNPGGLLVAQTESPFIHQAVIRRAVTAMREAFPVCRLYLGAVPTYPSGLWSYTIGSDGVDPSAPARPAPPGFAAKYYTSEVHRAAFALPPFVADLLKTPAAAS
jgi:spermidine synthase